MPATERVQGACQGEVDPALVAELSYPEELWAQRLSTGLMCCRVVATPDVAWIIAQTSPVAMSYPNMPYPVPAFEWVRTNLHDLLGEARSAKTATTLSGEPLPIAGVLIDFERRVYVR